MRGGDLVDKISGEQSETKRLTGFNSFNSSDIQENVIREQMPEILDILLIDRTMSTPKRIRNIIWANNNYLRFGAKFYSATSQITPNLVTGKMEYIIKPRALKTKMVQKERTKAKAEVFTPTWIVKKQNDIVDKGYKDDDLETYVKRTWLEVAAGEAPYMVTRYDMESGEAIPVDKRVGFVDRKLQRINRDTNDKAEWQRLVIEAFKASYGFEWNGDSLLLARENLLYTYRDNYVYKWRQEPTYGLFRDIATVISYNVFQMDGLKCIIPLTEKRKHKLDVQLSLFDDGKASDEWIVKPGKRVKIMNWSTNKMEFFDKGVKWDD